MRSTRGATKFIDKNKTPPQPRSSRNESIGFSIILKYQAHKYSGASCEKRNKCSNEQHSLLHWSLREKLTMKQLHKDRIRSFYMFLSCYREVIKPSKLLSLGKIFERRETRKQIRGTILLRRSSLCKISGDVETTWYYAFQTNKKRLLTFQKYRNSS